MRISWEVFLAKENIKKTAFVTFFLTIVLIVVLFLLGIYWMLFSFLIFFFTLNTYFLPIEYTIDKEKVYIKKWFLKASTDTKRFKRYILLKNGFLLTPFKKDTFLNNFRGIHLIVPQEKRKEVEVFLKDVLKLSP